MKIVNLSGKELNFYDKNRNLILSLKKEGDDFPVVKKLQKMGKINSLPILRFSFHCPNLINFPKEKPGIIYIVSPRLLEIIEKNRFDVFSYGNEIKEENGQILGYSSFKRPNKFL